MCGIMDQFANMMGKRDNVILLDCLTLDYEHLPLELQEYALVLINSKVEHSLTGGEYNQRRDQCREGFEILRANLPDVETFRDVKPADVERLKDKLTDVVYNRCLYVTQEIERTREAGKLLKNRELEAFGALMFQTHEGLSKLYEVSLPELDFLVDKAKAHPGIIGSRLMGGGFGGCTINLIKKESWNQVVEEITKEYKQRFNIDAEVYEVAVGDGTYEVVGL
jgi:galactokinase